MLEVNDRPVLIRQIELQIVERGFKEGWIRHKPPDKQSGRRVAVIGSGPAGLAAAQQLARAGHSVLVIEQDSNPGGMLRYGIPDFKLDKWIIDRRLDQLKKEGVEFQVSVRAGEDVSIRYMRQRFDAICLAMGARQPRDLDVPDRPDRELGGIVFALDYLASQNRLNAAEPIDGPVLPSARGKTVVVIGGGDTGSDCVGTAIRQGAKKVYQLEILPEPPQTRPADTPWPFWPRILRTSSSHQEGCERIWSVATKAFEGKDKNVCQVHCCKVEWVRSGPSWQPRDIPGTGFSLKAELVILAMGFVHVVHKGLVEGLGVALDQRGNVLVDSYQTNVPWVFAAGDTVSGVSLVVRAIASGRGAAEAIDRWLR
jgi:NAD(P)H-dependent glutamate synthase small subunit